MDLRNLLKNSARELLERPQYFVPRLLSSLISSGWMLATLYAMENQQMNLIYGGLAFFPVVFFLGTYAPVIVAEMVKTDSGLVKGVKQTFSYIPRVIGATFVVFVLLTVSVIPLYAGLALYLLSGALTGLIAGTLITLVMALGVTFLIYFLPITLTENGLTGSFQNSVKASTENRKEVGFLIVLSFLLLGVAATSSGALRGLGLIGFVAGRLVSSVLTTYLLIVSPRYYLEKS